MGTEWPAASTYVLSVGGTTLNLDKHGTYLSEIAWSGPNGGLSIYEPNPSFQSNWKNIIDTHRGVPDVAWNADPNTGVAVYYSTVANGWFVAGGTSVGAASLAATISIIDQGRTQPLSSGNLLNQLYCIAG